MTVTRGAALVLGALLLAAALPAAPALTAAPCPGFTVVPAQGPSCPVPGGWEVLLADGTRLLTHGPDRLLPFPDAAGASAGPADPACVLATSAQHHMLVIYAHASDAADRYATFAPQIRDLVKDANGRLRAAGDAHGELINYKVRCADNVITVVHATLPTASASTTFSSITGDLRSAGYTDIRHKYWVWFDGSVAPGVSGQGSIYQDDRLVLNNNNNAAPGTQASFAVTYGVLEVRTWMHENAHNLGAVQLSAPHSTGSWHCNDGLDVMCYADGGPSSAYVSNVCGTEQFDCGNDDYFHPAPPAGHHLRTHWNLGSPLGRFLLFGDGSNYEPVPSFTFECPQLTCHFDAAGATDPDGFLTSYQWDFGGATASGLTATHAYASPGTRPVTLTVIDNDGAVASLTRDVTTFTDAHPPVSDATLTGGAGLAPWFRGDVDVTVTATDGASGVARSWVIVDGGAATLYTGPVTVSAEGPHAIAYWSEDRAGNVEDRRTIGFSIDATPPAHVNVAPARGVFVDNTRVPGVDAGAGRAVVISTDPTAATFRVDSNVTDALSGVHDFTVYGGLSGTVLQCTAETGSGNSWSCDWPRGTTERGRQLLRIVARDLALNEAVVQVEVFG